MTDVVLPKSPVASCTLAPPGSWWWMPAGSAVAGIEECTQTHCVRIKCPLCQNCATLRDAMILGPRRDGTRGHDIAKDGVVSPSVVCPHNGCTWHVMAKLDGWSDE